MRIGRLNDLLAVKDTIVEKILRAIIDAVDGKLRLEDNLRCVVVRGVKFTTIDQEVPVPHDLGALARNFTIVGCDNYALFQWGDTAPTVDRLWIKCDHVPTVADILIFV